MGNLPRVNRYPNDGPLKPTRRVISGLMHCKHRVHLLDHLVGGRESIQRDIDAEHLGGLEVDDELEFRGLLDWNICRLFAFQDFFD